MKKIIISDCDGILTNGTSIYTADGKVAKIYGAYDTEAIEMAYDNGWEFLFVTNDSKGIDITFKRISEYVKKGWVKTCLKASAKERVNLVKKYISEGYLVVFVGDSISDIDAGESARLFATVNNAFDIVKDRAQYVAKRDGGNGGFAEIVYFVNKHFKDQL